MSFSNDNGDCNENVQKVTGLISPAREAYRFWYISLPSLRSMARTRNLFSYVTSYGELEYMTYNELFFLDLNLGSEQEFSSKEIQSHLPF